MYLSEAIQWMASVRPAWKDGKGAHTANTNAAHCLAVLGDVDVETINATSFTSLQNNLKEAGLKNATINRKTAALTTILNTLKRHEKLQRAVPIVELLPEPKGRKDYYTEAEVSLMLSFCHRLDDGELVADCIRFACLTGARQGEILDLTWDCIDFEQRELVFLDTKNGEDRYLPLMPELYGLLERMHRERLDDGVVFDIDNQSLLRRLRRLQNWAGVSTKKCFHTFRHTAATNLFAKGAELPVVADVLGHKDWKTTRRYSHATKEGMAKALSTL